MKQFLHASLVAAAVAAGPALAAAPGALSTDISMPPAPTLAVPATAFPRPEMLEPAVAFWTRVFAEYSEFQSVIHSMDQADRVYMVLDFRDEAARLGPAAARRQQQKSETAVKRELDRHLKRVHELRLTPEKLSPIEQRVYDLFADGTDPDRYKKAIGRFRSQRGLQEATERALQVSGLYLPKMEEIFLAEGLPRELTRLPLVESSFNVDAYSKVGAAGLWQFIPSSARLYMRLDEAVDDRRDPWTSTQAAAAHLKEDYATLGSWPLAITAYNHGRGGLARGLREVGGNSLEDLLERWDGRRFGFASRNFYAEFLAAVDVERDHHEHFGPVERPAALEFDTVKTDHYVSYDVLRRCAQADEATFRRLNPGFRPEVLDGRLYVPPQSTIRVPVGTAEAFKTAYTALSAEERFEQQRHYYVRYRVQRGETLGHIAHRHGVSPTALMNANGIGNPRRLRAGQVLRIPPRHGAPRATKVAATEPRPAAVASAAGYLLHRVRPGQSLYTIARRYRTTIDALKALNGLGEADILRAGVTLKVPSY